MKAQIITIGDELLIGQVLDTNSQFIAKMLNDNGFRVDQRMTVSDRRGAIICSVTEAMAEAEVVITTGGLGPTNDDITKNTMAELFDCEMVEHTPTHERNKRTLEGRGIKYNALNRSQALVPACCTVLPNQHGTAPGMWFEQSGHVLVCLPGVPFEMARLMEDEVIPRLRNHFKIKDITHRTMVTYGMAESMLAERIEMWEDKLPHDLQLAYLPGPSGVRLRLSAYERDNAVMEIEQRFTELEHELGNVFVGYGSDATVQEAVARILRERGQTLAIAESCTGGAVAALFTAMEGASDYFWGGAVTYDSAAKTKLLGVDTTVIESEGVVSQAVAEQMAIGVRSISGVDWAIATTGVAGPTGGTDEKPVGTVWIAVVGPAAAAPSASKSKSRGARSSTGVAGRVQGDAFVLSHKFTFGQLRNVNIERAAAAAINMLREALMAATPSLES